MLRLHARNSITCHFTAVVDAQVFVANLGHGLGTLLHNLSGDIRLILDAVGGFDSCRPTGPSRSSCVTDHSSLRPPDSEEECDV